MAGITHKSCVTLFPLRSLKKTFLGGYSKCELAETNKKFRALIRSHVSMMTTLTTIVISVITKIKNSNSNSDN